MNFKSDRRYNMNEAETLEVVHSVVLCVYQEVSCACMVWISASIKAV